MKVRILFLAGLFFLISSTVISPRRLGADNSSAEGLVVGFGEADITPTVGPNAAPVYIAGYGHNRKATEVHDPLKARAVVLKHDGKKIALISIDVVGYGHEQVEAVRKHLTDFTYVLVSSTHNHEGPDTIGIWGPTLMKSGVDPLYMKYVESQIVKAVQSADNAAGPVKAKIGAAKAPDLVDDSREPYIKHDELVAVEFLHANTGKPAGIIVQWNCHPETLEGRNTKVSADFVHYTVKYLQTHYHCPVVYLTGTVGGLMTSMHLEISDREGRRLGHGTMEKTERYGQLIGELADIAIGTAKSAELTPLYVRSRIVYVPMDNRGFQVMRRAGILARHGYAWSGDPYKAELLGEKASAERLCLRTEVAWLRFGQLDVAAIPGEIYPELVLDKVQDPPDPGADFPDAPIEPAIYKQLRGPYRMIIGLANDEVGYILPKRQWDVKAPFCYGRKKDQYGEQNSLGPDAAPTLCNAFKDLVDGQKAAK